MAEADDRSKRRKVELNAGANSQDFSLVKDCVRLHLVSTREESENAGAFYCPEFVEDHLGKEGKIYGYKGLMIDVWVHAASFHAFAQVKYDAVNPQHKDYEDVWTGLKEFFGEDIMASRDSFLQNFPSYGPQFSDMLRDHGEVLTRWSSVGGSGGSDVNEIFRLELQDAKSWVTRITPLILMSVEGASAIDLEDPQWEVYIAVETSGGIRKVAGFCTVYRFFHYPDSQRLRISQILVLPPYQNKKYGYHLLNSINEVAQSRDSYDVTMEEPSDQLQDLRLCMDVIRLLKSSLVASAVNDAVAKITSEDAAPPKAKGILLPPADLTSSVRRQLKISGMQFKQCWEVLMFLHVTARAKFWELMIAKLCAELFGNDEKDRAASKRIMDTENEFDDSSRAFVMMRFKGVEGNNGDAEQQQQVEKGEEAMQELLKDREEQLNRVARRVAAICKADESIPVSFDVRDWQE